MNVLDLLEKYRAPEWFRRGFVYAKYIFLTCLLWYWMGWLLARLQLTGPAWVYVAVVMTVWIMIEWILLPENKKEHDLLRMKVITLYISDKIRPISSAPSASRGSRQASGDLHED